MESGAATSENNAPDVAQLGGRHVQAAQLRGAFFHAKTAAHRIAHRVGLLKDLLEHVMSKIAFLEILGREFDFAHSMIATFSGERSDLEFVLLQLDHIEVIQVNSVAGVSNDCAHIAGQKIFAFTNPENQRASSSRTDHKIRNIRVDEGNAICADHLLKRGANGGE